MTVPGSSCLYSDQFLCAKRWDHLNTRQITGCLYELYEYLRGDPSLSLVNDLLVSFVTIVRSFKFLVDEATEIILVFVFGE